MTIGGRYPTAGIRNSLAYQMFKVDIYQCLEFF